VNTQCCYCGRTDDSNLSNWARDPEGLWWHRECRREFLEYQAAIDDYQAAISKALGHSSAQARVGGCPGTPNSTS
jgi:hypothetical protein